MNEHAAIDPLQARLSRRRLLIGAGSGLALLSTSGLVAACGGTDSGSGGGSAGGSGEAGTGTLNVLSWPGMTEPGFVAPLDGLTVEGKEYVGGDEMLALATSAEPGTYDIVHLDAEYVPQLAAAGLLAELDRSKYPAVDGFFEEFRDFPGMEVDGKLYGVPLKFGFNGIAYRTDVLSASDIETKGAALLWEPAMQGEVGWFDWYLPSMGALSAYLGNENPYDISDSKLDELKAELFSLRGQTKGFYSLGDLLTALSNGEVSIVAGSGFWVTQLLTLQDLPVAAGIPPEGGVQWVECLAILKDARNPEAAERYLQYAISPEGQANVATLEAYQSSIPNPDGWDVLADQDPEMAEFLRLESDVHPNVIDDLREPGRIHLRSLPVQQPPEAWNAIWTEFKNG